MVSIGVLPNGASGQDFVVPRARVDQGGTFHPGQAGYPEHAAYLEQIRTAAEGLPVVLHPDATGAELRDLYGKASIFWPAAGPDEHIQRLPDRHAHFGLPPLPGPFARALSGWV